MLPAEEQPAVKRALAAVPQRRWPNCRVFVRELANPDKRDRDDRPRGFPPPPSDAPPRRDRVAQVQPEPGIADGPSRQPIPAGLTETASLDERVRAGNELVPGYRLTKLLGRGGFGEVWETRGPGGKHCALKIVRNLDAGQGRQVFRSLDLIRDLDHERLIGLQTFWLLDARGAVIDDDQFGMPNVPVPSVLVMAIDLAAMNLLSRWQEYAARGEPGIPAAELLRYVRQAAEGIDYLNAQSIQHRDIKPEHLLLTRDDRVKVSGFSLVKLVEGAAVPVHSASVGLTPAYAAPELFGNTVTRWTDQYSLALTYYKLRTGHWPFPPDSGPFQMMRAHVEGQLDLSAVGESEQRVLARATALEPSARYTSCQEMVEELGQALGIAPTVTLPAPPLTDTATYAPAPVAPAPRLSRPPSLAERAENYLKLPSRASLAPAPPSAKADAWRAPAAKSGSGWGPAVFLLLLLGLVGGGLGYFVRHPAGPQPAPDAESLPLVVTLVLAGAAIGVLILVIVAAAGRRARKSRVSPVSSRPVPTPSQELGDTAPTIVRTMQFGEQIGLAPELVDEMRSLLALGQQRDLTPEEKDRLRELAELSRGPAATEPRQAGLRALPARRSLAGHQDAVWCVAAVGGMRAISGSMDHTLRLWDLRTGREERCLTGHTDGVVSVSVSPTGDEALSASLDGTLRLWDLVSGAEKRVIDAGIGRLFAAALVPGDAPCAVAGGDDGALRLLDLTTGAGVRWFVGHNQRITGLAVSPDGHWVVSASEDHALRLWDVRTGEQQREFIGHAAAVQSVTFTPDGAHLVSGSADHTARWWDVATGAELRRFEGHSDWVRSVSVAPDGRHILTGSDDETVRLWQVPGVVPVRVFNDHVGSVLSVAFAADGRLALSASDDWTVIVRRLDAD
jgi:serine/threonine protein kinase